MKRGSSESWRISIDIPEELQFAGYIAQREGFLIGRAGEALSQAEIKWRNWWGSLMNSRPAVEQAMKQHTDPRTVMDFDPHEFARLEAHSALQTLCKGYWPEFQKQWGIVGGQKLSYVDKMNKQLQQVRLDKIIKECLREAGKRRSNPFDLQVGFVLWPDPYHHQVSDRYVILEAQFLEPEHLNDLAVVLKTMIGPLVRQ